jgi:hypothetical protein
MSPESLYEATRSAWYLSRRRCEKVKLALAVAEDEIKEVYEIKAWFKDGDTRCKTSPYDLEPNRLEFIGHLADEQTRRKYVGQPYVWGRHGNPVRYVNA